MKLQTKNCELKIKNSGQAVITVVILLLIVSLAAVLGFSSVVLRDVKTTKMLLMSKKSYFLSESGVEDAVYRIIKGKEYSDEEVISIGGFFATTTISSLSGNEKEITAFADVFSARRKIKTILSTDVGASFHYGVQVGDGGLLMQNNSLVEGNVYSNGPINGSNSNEVRGDVVSAGAFGLVDGVYATGTVYSNTISNSNVDKDAYYQVISNTTVTGALFPGSPDQPTSDLPISDETISGWENATAAVSVINSPCPYIIKSDISIGPVKINCDLKIKGSPNIILTGTVWVVGNISVENSAEISLSPSFNEKSVAIIADNPSNRMTSSKVDMENSVEFDGSGTAGSYVLVISMNNSAENGGSETAIEVEQSVSGKLLVYASHGEIRLKNSVNLKEVSAYKINIRNSAKVIYETGLANLLFDSGPGGSFSVSSWEEI